MSIFRDARPHVKPTARRVSRPVDPGGVRPALPLVNRLIVKLLRKLGLA